MSKIYEALRLAQVERQGPVERKVAVERQAQIAVVLRDALAQPAFEPRSPSATPHPTRPPPLGDPPAPPIAEPPIIDSPVVEPPVVAPPKPALLRAPPSRVGEPPKPQPGPGNRLASREDMLSLALKIETLLGEAGSRVIAMMSSRPGEGASSIARDFALAVAEAGERQVLLIDANPGKHDLHRSFGLAERVGLEELARHQLPIDAALHQLTPPNLHLARLVLDGAAGRSMLDATSLDWLLAQLRERFGDIVIDAPPVVPSGTGMVLARRADGIVLVLAAERTRAPVVEQAKKMIEAHKSRLLGVVMNRRRHHIPKLIYRLL